MRNEFVTMPEFSMDLVEAAQRAEGILGEMPLEMLIDVYVRYKQFWFICKKYPEEMICPTHDIDQMWHLHMLHPKKYYHDCMGYFGEIMDHNAGFGKMQEEYEVLEGIYDNSEEIWNMEFNQSYDIGIKKDTFQNIGMETCYKEPLKAKSMETCYKEPLKAKSMETCYKEPLKAKSMETCYKEPLRAKSMETCYKEPLKINQ
ncbi:glycine-rich domain-containing protein-like [Bacillus paranthracis]|uniref:glycine-rich domain-containing protein-like n=1 Tax=Bacillus paranthracis TaxID=2026186 RepID=UPI003D20AA0E